jgi:hypothetical protein
MAVWQRNGVETLGMKAWEQILRIILISFLGNENPFPVSEHGLRGKKPLWERRNSLISPLTCSVPLEEENSRISTYG